MLIIIIIIILIIIIIITRGRIHIKTLLIHTTMQEMR